jgi:hypothetical protein
MELKGRLTTKQHHRGYVCSFIILIVEIIFNILFVMAKFGKTTYQTVKHKIEKTKGNSTLEIKQNLKCNMIGNNKFSHIE